MTFIEYIDTKYPIEEKIKQLRSDPIKQILERDDLPYDEVKYVDGELQKVISLSDGSYVPVIEVLSYCKEDVAKIEDVEMRNAFSAYMDNIDITDMSIDAIMSASRDYIKNRKHKEELINKCTN